MGGSVKVEGRNTSGSGAATMPPRGERPLVTPPGAAAGSEAEAQPAPLSEGRASVSVVIPCYNEERFVGKVLEGLAAQYEHSAYEIVIVDGGSSDGTREVVSQFAESHTVRVRLVENPARVIPAALNRGIEEAGGEIIVRMDAHSVPSENYVRRCVEALGEPDVAVVGMPWRIRPGADTSVARAISLAVAHPFGIGDAKYRLAGSAGAQFVDTVPFGAFRKSLWREVGGFNEELLANEDYDFYYRVRRRGGRILLDGSGFCQYFARPTFQALVSQYARYGNWKAQMLKLHPRSVRWRQIVAPAFVLSLVLFGALGFWWGPAWWALLAVLTPYALLSLLFAFKLSGRGGDRGLTPLIAFGFFLIHCAWGGSFLIGLVRPPRRRAG